MKRSYLPTLKGAVAAVVLSLAGGTALAQDVVELVYSDTVSETDRRSTILNDVFASCLGDGFKFTPYFGATLFKQLTEQIARQLGG